MGKPRVKASWESLMGKPRGKAIDRLIHEKGSLTLLLQLGRHFLGTQGISLRVCGAENPSQGPWEPGALGAALILGGLEIAGGALQLPFPSL